VRALAAALVASLLGGCLGGGGGGPAAAGALLDQAAVDGCDGPVWPGRVRAREVDVAADPGDRSRVAAAMMVSIPSMRALAPNDPAVWMGVARSSDGGRGWRAADLSGWPGDPGIAASPFAGSAVVGDPIVRFLPDGTLLLVGLAIRGGAWIDLFAARFEGDGLAPTEVSTVARGGYGEPSLSGVPGPYQLFYNDKPEVGVDPATGDVYVGWMWRTNRPDGGAMAVPVVSLSRDGGRTWEGPVELVERLGAGLTSEGLQAGTMPFVAGGRAHAVWYDAPAQALWVRSAPAGTLDFGERRKVHDVSGLFEGRGGPLALSFPYAAVGPGPGGAGERAYLVWVEDADAEGRGTDVALSHSDDGGLTWSSPVRVNQDDGPADQLLADVAVSPEGVVAVSFLDRRHDPANSEYHAYLAASRDGLSFEEVRMSSRPTAPERTGDGLQPIGDYYGVAYGSGGFVAAWEDGRDGTAEVPYGTAYSCVVPVRA
jgi:hypothetical protein